MLGEAFKLNYPMKYGAFITGMKSVTSPPPEHSEMTPELWSGLHFHPGTDCLVDGKRTGKSDTISNQGTF